MGTRCSTVLVTAMRPTDASDSSWTRRSSAVASYSTMTGACALKTVPVIASVSVKRTVKTPSTSSADAVSAIAWTSDAPPLVVAANDGASNDARRPARSIVAVA